VRRGDSARDDAVDVQVGGEVPIGLLEQGEREVELGLGDALAEVEVDAIGHVLASERTGPSGEAKQAAAALGDRVESSDEHASKAGARGARRTRVAPAGAAAVGAF
jgi:hypothetical protein